MSDENEHQQNAKADILYLIPRNRKKGRKKITKKIDATRKRRKERNIISFFFFSSRSSILNLTVGTDTFMLNKKIFKFPEEYFFFFFVNFTEIEKNLNVKKKTL